MENAEIKKEINKLKLLSIAICAVIILISGALFSAALNQNSFVIPIADELSVKVLTIMAAFCMSLSFLIKYDDSSKEELLNFKRTYRDRAYAKGMGFAFGLVSYFLSNDLSILLTVGLITIVLLLIDFPTKRKALKFV